MLYLSSSVHRFLLGWNRPSRAGFGYYRISYRQVVCKDEVDRIALGSGLELSSCANFNLTSVPSFRDSLSPATALLAVL